jgi:ribosome-binding factor A
MSGSRKDRVGTAIHHELTGLLQNALNDPRLGFVTVTGVDMSKDMRHAQVFVSILGSDTARSTSLEALASASGFLRRELAHRLNMRRTPDLRFRLDLSGDRGERIDQLLYDAGLGHGAPAAEPPADEESPAEGQTPTEPKADGSES